MIINKPLTTAIELQDEVMNILSQEPPTDKNVISLYELTQYQRKKRRNLSTDNGFAAEEFNKACQEKLSSIKSNMVDYNKKELILEYEASNGLLINLQLIKDRKGDMLVKDYYPKNSYGPIQEQLENATAADEVIRTYIKEYPTMKKDISKLYDAYMKNRREYLQLTEKNYIMNAINSILLVGFNFDGVSIFTMTNKTQQKLFEIQSNTFYPTSFKGEEVTDYTYTFGNNEIVKAVTEGLEQNIFKSTYVEIRKCPPWAQKDLYKIRRRELRNIKCKEKLKVK